jgi:DNA polymerase-2
VTNSEVDTYGGFLLTSRWYEGESTTELEFWFASRRGPLCVIVEQPSVCFIPHADRDKAQRLARAEGIQVNFREVQLNSFSLQPVIACYLRQAEIYRLKYLLSDWDIQVWEHDIRPTDRYLMERFIRGGADITGNWQWCGQPEKKMEKQEDSSKDGGYLLCRSYLESCQQEQQEKSATVPNLISKNIKIRPSQTVVEETELTVLSVDIETSFPKDGKKDRLFSIACHGEVIIHGVRETVNHIWMIGVGADSNIPAAEHCEYLADEIELLTTFFAEIQRLDPDIIIGWNFIQFDMEFLQRKCDEFEIPFILGRSQQEVSWRHDQNNTNRSYVHVPGRCIIDGIEMLRQAQYNFESFALDAVAEELLDRNKLISGDAKVFDGYDHEIEYLFDHDKPALAAYNLEDCILVADIFNKTELIEFAIQRSRLTGLLLDRMGGSVAGFENLYLPLLHRAGYVAPNYGEGFSDIKSPGGFVMDSRPGLYDSILVLDFKSLYPSIMRTFKIDPMGLIEGLKNEDPEAIINGFNGGLFDRKRHCLPDLITMLGQQRDQAKKDNNHHLAQAIKIIMSSFYGVLGSDGCRFFDVRLSSSITQRSHEIIQRSAQWIETQDYDVIYGDTDSVFVWLKEKKTQQQADAIGKRLSSGLNRWWQETIKQEHQLDSLLEIEYETHYHKFFMPSIRGAETGSKKRYAGTVQKVLSDDEVTTVTIFKGLEAVRSDWTPLAREFQRQLFHRVFSELPFADWMKSEIAELMLGKKDQQLIYRKRLRQPLSEYQRNVPPHAKAAAVLEIWRKQQGLPLLYQNRGGWIQYVMTTNGPQPLAVYQHAKGSLQIDYQHYLEKQLAPVCDGLLVLYDTSFAKICGQQMSLF